MIIPSPQGAEDARPSTARRPVGRAGAAGPAWWWNSTIPPLPPTAVVWSDSGACDFAGATRWYCSPRAWDGRRLTPWWLNSKRCSGRLGVAPPGPYALAPAALSKNNLSQEPGAQFQSPHQGHPPSCRTPPQRGGAWPALTPARRCPWKERLHRWTRRPETSRTRSTRLTAPSRGGASR